MIDPPGNSGLGYRRKSRMTEKNTSARKNSNKGTPTMSVKTAVPRTRRISAPALGDYQRQHSEDERE